MGGEALMENCHQGLESQQRIYPVWQLIGNGIGHVQHFDALHVNSGL